MPSNAKELSEQFEIKDVLLSPVTIDPVVKPSSASFVPEVASNNVMLSSPDDIPDLKKSVVSGDDHALVLSEVASIAESIINKVSNVTPEKEMLTSDSLDDEVFVESEVTGTSAQAVESTHDPNESPTAEVGVYVLPDRVPDRFFSCIQSIDETNEPSSVVMCEEQSSAPLNESLVDPIMINTSSSHAETKALEVNDECMARCSEPSTKRTTQVIKLHNTIGFRQRSSSAPVLELGQSPLTILNDFCRNLLDATPPNTTNSSTTAEQPKVEFASFTEDQLIHAVFFNDNESVPNISVKLAANNSYSLLLTEDDSDS